MTPKLTLCSRIRKLSSKNTVIFLYNLLSINAVIRCILLACQNHRHSGVAYGRREKSVATASRSRWRHNVRQKSSVGDRSLYCIAFSILLATGIGSPDGVKPFSTSRHSGTSCKCLSLRQPIIWARMTSRHCQFMTPRLPGSFKQTRGSRCLSWQPSDSS